MKMGLKKNWCLGKNLANIRRFRHNLDGVGVRRWEGLTV